MTSRGSPICPTATTWRGSARRNTTRTRCASTSISPPTPRPTLASSSTATGWTHRRSTFDLLRPVSNDWTIAEPTWPDGVALREYSPDDAEAIYRLIYVDA